MLKEIAGSFLFLFVLIVMFGMCNIITSYHG